MSSTSQNQWASIEEVAAEQQQQQRRLPHWPGEAEFEWQKEKGITKFLRPDHVRRLGIEDVIKQNVAIVGKGVVFLTIDVDVLDRPSRRGPARRSRAASPRQSCCGPR